MWHSLPLRMIFCTFNLYNGGTAITLHEHVWSCVNVDLHESWYHRYLGSNLLQQLLTCLMLEVSCQPIKRSGDPKITCLAHHPGRHTNRTGAKGCSPVGMAKPCYLILFSSKTKSSAFTRLFCWTYVWNILCPKEVWQSSAFRKSKFLDDQRNFIDFLSSCRRTATLLSPSRPRKEDAPFDGGHQRCIFQELSAYHKALLTNGDLCLFLWARKTSRENCGDLAPISQIDWK